MKKLGILKGTKQGPSTSSESVKRRQLVAACSCPCRKERKASDCSGRGGASSNRTELMDVELSVPCKGETSKELVIEALTPNQNTILMQAIGHWLLLLV